LKGPAGKRPFGGEAALRRTRNPEVHELLDREVRKREEREGNFKRERLLEWAS